MAQRKPPIAKTGRPPVVRLVRGPAKRKLGLRKSNRVSSHKIRARWFQARASWPRREPPAGKLERERRRAASRVPVLKGSKQWVCVGPTNIGGRLTCITPRPDNPDRLLVGAAGGGVWRSNDAGRTWKALWHRRDLNIGAITRDPQNADVVYCATGEANLSTDSYPGTGVYKSANDGRTWRLLASCARHGVPARIGAISVDPFDSRHLRIGGVTHSDDEVGGLFTSRDGGLTWARETFVSNRPYWCHCVVFDPKRRGRLFVSIGERGSKNGIWRSVNGGESWQQLLRGLPDPSRCGRVMLAIAQSDSQIVYAQIADSFEGVLGVFRSEDGGDSWRNVAGSHFRDEGQMSYGNTIAVRPDNPDAVICGGVDLHRTTNAGVTWRQATHWDAERDAPDYAHADHHALVIALSKPDRIYDCNDGGLDVSEDGGKTWVNRSAGLAITMFYDADVAQADPKCYGGGAQDNGTLITQDGKPDQFDELFGGDGGWLLYDPQDPIRVIATCQNFYMRRFDRLHPRGIRISPPAPASEQDSVWMTFTAFDPRNFKRIYAGSTRLWRTDDDGEHWKAISGHFDSSPITAVEVAGADPRRLYIGTENGGLFRSTDGGTTWSGNLAGAEIPGFTITRIESSPSDANRLFLTVSNFGHSHVFSSRDGGLTWHDIDGGQLPDVPHHAIAIQPDNPKRVFVCNDAGVYASVDEGVTWRSVVRNLPYVPVVDLVFRPIDRSLIVATYGRSMWRIELE